MKGCTTSQKFFYAALILFSVIDMLGAIPAFLLAIAVKIFKSNPGTV